LSRLQVTKRTIILGGRTFILPLRVNGFYVDDANGNTIAEAPTQELAKAIHALLMEKFDNVCNDIH
jgi:hypothetical protein